MYPDALEAGLIGDVRSPECHHRASPVRRPGRPQYYYEYTRRRGCV